MFTFHTVITRYIIQSSWSNGSNCVAFLHSEIALLVPIDLIVNIKYDGTYVKPRVQEFEETASRIQCFMLTSVMSNI